LSKKAQGLLVYLITTGRSHSRDALAGLLWSDFPDHRARANLRGTLSELHAVLQDHLSFQQHFVAVASDREVTFSDAAVFQGHVEQAQQALKHTTSSTTHSKEIIICLEEAVALYEGEFLSGFYVHRAAVFEEWLTGLRARLHQLAVNALRILTQTYATDGQYSAGVIHAQRLLELDPWREEGQRQLMRLLALGGQQSAALKQYDICRQVLQEELGLDPSAETTALFQAIRAGEIQPADDKLRRGAELPMDDAPFIGREEELIALGKLIADPDIRLINITGPGGIGKTRLALAAARGQEGGFANGLTFFPLAALDSGRQLAPALVAMLELSTNRGDSSKEKLLSYLQDKEQLLLLDSFEHLLDGKALLSEMLIHAPWLKILVTSRTALNLREEQRFPIGGLTLPVSRTKPGIMEADAARLFLQSARRQQPDFELLDPDIGPLIHICHLVEGMPLALELAAGWANSIALSSIAEQLESSLDVLQMVDSQITDRHASMRSVFESSWQQLSEQQRQDFRVLAVFQGGFTSHAAHRIGGLSALALSQLVSKSLVHYERRKDRYRMHELLRQFAATKLASDDAEEASTRARHAAYYCQLLAKAEDDLKGPGQDEALLAIDAELGNIRRMWKTASESADVNFIAGALDALALYYRYRLQPDELVNFCQIAIDNLKLPVAGDDYPMQSRRLLTQLRALQAAPYVHATIGSEFLASDQSRQVLEGCLKELNGLAMTGEDVRRERAFVALRLGAQVLNVDLARATELFEESLAICEELDDIWGQSEALHYLSSAQLG
jgi:predicted ATPase/DNA-binding SARP family transcriptional activator